MLKKIKDHIMTGVSFMVPVVVGAGLCMALGNILGGVSVADNPGTLAYYIYMCGKLGMNMVVPVIGAAIAYSITDRPGIAPGLVVGLVSVEVKAGFLGAIAGALIIGYMIDWLKKNLKLPASMQGLIPVLILPFVGCLAGGVLMYTLLGTPIAWLMDMLTGFMEGLSGTGNLIYGFVMGALSGVDLGGPVGKVVYAYTVGLMSEGIFAPKAAQMIACMTRPLGIFCALLLSWITKKTIWTNQEKEAVKACLPMGLCFITEACIPLAMNDLIRTIATTSVGAGVTGALIMLWNVGCPVAHGGIFVFPAMSDPVKALLALLAGTLVTGVLLLITKPRLTKEQAEGGMMQENMDEEVGDINITF